MRPVSRWRSPKWTARRLASVPLPEAAGPSMAMIMRSHVSAQPAHQVDKSREAGGDEGGIVDRHRRLGAEPHHQGRHGDAMIHVGGNLAAAVWAALAAATAGDDEIVADDLHLGAVDTEHVGGGGEAVGFLHAQLLQAAHAGFACGE